MWEWLRDPDNRQILKMLGGGLVIVASGTWAVIRYLRPHRPHGKVGSRDISATFSTGSAPPVPSLVVGREDDLSELKARLGISGIGRPPAALHRLTVIRGWPGVGKTTVVAAMAHDAEVDRAFPDGTLWTCIGETPDVLALLAAWGRQLGIADLVAKSANNEESINEASSRLADVLKTKRRLLIIDDVWDVRHFRPFKVGGKRCATLVTTRQTCVADAIAQSADDIYLLGILEEEKALELLKRLAPNVVDSYPKQSRELVKILEGLPLSLQVAGRMLNKEVAYGFGVTDLLDELQKGMQQFLKCKAPADRAESSTGVIPSVTVLLAKSTNRLLPEIRERFAMLGPFAPKPATFGLQDLEYQWKVVDAKPIVDELIDCGLLETVALREGTRFWMHGLLVDHAKSLLQDMETSNG